MFLIVGLGNFGPKYEQTRHNAGFICADEFVRRHGLSFKTEPKFRAEIASGNVFGEKVILAKPLTYMNLSGEAVVKIAQFYKIEPQNIFVVFDDISIPIGQLRFKSKGSDGGHNGIKSLTLHLSSNDFPRLKIGIGPQPDYMKSEDYVLGKFTAQETEILQRVIPASVDAVEEYLKSGIVEAQNKYNGIDLSD
ncbi:MAG: aminoacyl-tRNA hydrolase [Candidatus Gastranaerophilales bacterium]|nr:aminoacyl-tRNA hydrolase [Candidatus Gastranaerophilales bacterium]